MADRPMEELTLRQMFTTSERLLRELIDHLDQGFIPKTRQLARLIRPIEDDPDRAGLVEDITIRNYAEQVLKSEDFTDQLYGRFEEHCKAIDATVSRIVTEG